MENNGSQLLNCGWLFQEGLSVTARDGVGLAAVHQDKVFFTKDFIGPMEELGGAQIDFGKFPIVAVLKYD